MSIFGRHLDEPTPSADDYCAWKVVHRVRELLGIPAGCSFEPSQVLERLEGLPDGALRGINAPPAPSEIVVAMSLATRIYEATVTTPHSIRTERDNVAAARLRVLYEIPAEESDLWDCGHRDSD